MTTPPIGGGVSMGPATDRKNEPVMDPTPNVVALVASAVSRQDDLRELTQSAIHQRIEDIKVLLDERYGTQTKAVEAAFSAQQTAMTAALTAAERAVTTALQASEKATLKAEAASDKRFDSVNAFRAQLNDQAATFMPRRESEANWHRASDAIEALTKQITGTVGRAEVQGAIAAITERHNELVLRVTRAEGQDAGAGVAAQLATIKQQIDHNSQRIITSAGERAGSNQAWQYLVAAIGVAAAVIGIIVGTR